MVTPIVKEPNPILHQKAVAVRKITEEIRRLIASMVETMHAAQGVGLAANQVGSPLNILVASPDGKRGNELVLLNGRITEAHGQIASPEGCLSVPGVSAEVVRASEVTAEGLDREGKAIRIRAAGLMARILQHEIDHLAGHLYLDRLNLFQRQELLRQYATSGGEESGATD